MPISLDAGTSFVVTLAGTGASAFAGDGGPALSASLSGPMGVSVDPYGNVFVADTGNHRLRSIDVQGQIQTIAGTGTPGFSGDGGPATTAQLSSPAAVAIDPSGAIYVADTGNHVIRKIDLSGNIATVAGGGSQPPGPAPVGALNVSLSHPRALATDLDGSLYIADDGAQMVLRLDPAGSLQSIAGTGVAGFSGDGGAAATAQLNGPMDVAVDASGNVYIADSGNQRIRIVNPSGTIASAIQPGGPLPDGEPAPADPTSVTIQNGGTVFFADAGTLELYGVQGNNPVPVAGSGSDGFNGDVRPAQYAYLNPSLVRAAADGILYIADAPNNRIRMVVPDMPNTLGSDAVVNSGSYRLGALSPGEIVTIFGAAIGPTTLDQYKPGVDFPLILQGTQVLFDGNPAPLVYVSPNQISAVVPYSVANNPSTTLAITNGGVATNAVSLPVTGVAPGLFSLDTTGTGQAAALNNDYSTNSTANPAQVGSVLTVFVTGEGITQPSQVAGSVAVPPFATPNAAVSALVDGVAAEVVYAGGAPGTYEGLIEVQLKVPSGARLNQAVPIVITIGSGATQAGVTIVARGAN
jgi:uncharacterized protein (TIGR03437 family)